MIGRVYRGVKVAGLVRYLYGPGRHNEHVDQHLVACWSGSTPEVLAVVEPERIDEGGWEYRGLVAELQAPARYAERLGRNPVWHCPLRTAPGDRVLSDAEWAEVAEDLMDRTGIAPRGDDGGCRWIAVRHDEQSIHVVAVLARQDGGRAHPDNDWHQVRRTCLAAEQRLGLQVTAPADKTAARHTSRAEVELSARRGQALPARDWLREQVQYAAAGARDPAGFLDRLRAGGVEVRERHDETGQLSGYAVGRREPGRETVLFGGGKLAADLSLPKLQARWAAAAGAAGRPDAGLEVGGQLEVRAGLWEQATAAAALAAEELRVGADADLAGAGDAAAAAAEVLSAASRLIEGPAGGPLTDAARDYDRAAREVRSRLPAPGRGGSVLRTAALQLAQGGRQPGRGEAAQIALLIAQLGRLSVSVSRLRAAQGRAAQAAAARRAALHVRDAGSQWTEKAQALLTDERHASATAPGAAQLMPPPRTSGHQPPPEQAPRGPRRGR